MPPTFEYEAGAAVIREFLKTAPSLPGVYRMLDAKGNALYVGKAKHIRNRVGSYVNPSGLSLRIMTMVAQTKAMEITITRTEAEALLLEANIIKKMMPRYNILLRDDKSFPSILVTGDHEFPQVLKHRGAQSRQGKYYGPFASGNAVNQTLSVLQRAFLLRPCSDSMFKNRTRPCLQFQIKRCSAPCVGHISAEDYGGLVEQASQFLKGKSRDVQNKLVQSMKEASEAQNYETAAQLRDRVQALTAIQQQQSFINLAVDDGDLFAFYREGAHSCVQVFFFRDGQNFGNKAYFPSHAADSTDVEILSAFIGQFYQTRVAPHLVMTSITLPDAEILEEALSLTTPYTVQVHAPERGDKKTALEQALINAKRSLQTRASEQATASALLTQTAEVFGMLDRPRRIEVYDNSHISGTNAVGGMIVAGADGFQKKNYRKFNFKTTELAGGDDYAMMREMLTRRFTRLQKEDPDRTGELWPDLVLIDGGLGQLSSAMEVFRELGIENLECVAISKGPDRNAGREWFHRSGHPSFQLPPTHPVLHYMQRLRDEAHRFAIGSHRTRRSNAMRTSPLDEIIGVGSARRRALLHHFGSAKAVEDATLEELKKVAGISAGMALKLYEHFHKQ